VSDQLNQVFFSARSALAISRGASALSERQLLLTRTTTRKLVMYTRDVKEERTESWFIIQGITIETVP
jgi:hypothetical protein